MAAAISASRSAMGRVNGSRAGRVNMLLIAVFHAFAPLAKALPLGGLVHALADEELPKSPEDASLWVYLGIAVALVLAGGVFAGLTIALMGQDEIYLQVLATSGEPHERRTSKKVLRLLKYGKHWVLVTLLLSNVITNETLPIVLDRSLGGGWPAVLSSTVLIVIFGEVVPQSICVRYGLPIGAWMAPMVLGLMWLMSPVAWPTAKLLDYLLGEDHGTTYKKAGLKSLVTLHQSLGHADERLNEDEVTIISAVLDLKAKPVGSIMTPMKDVFTMPSDTVLDEKMMENILSAGYSRIPIHVPDNKNDFVGMLLVKMLITYDPEDALRVREFALATLPETRPETSCLDIINFFQEGKSHMVLVSDFPGDSHGAVGVVTLEDVIEELIGESVSLFFA
jgi:metal transporter CNNM